MEKNFGQNAADIVDYVENLLQPEKESFWREVREGASERGIPSIHVGRMDGLHLEVLVAAMGARKAVEIGTLAGYSGVRILRGMRSVTAEKVKLHTFEYSEMHAEFARENFRKAGFSEEAKVWVGPALSSLPKIEGEGPFDLVFIDADKVNYPGYFAWAAKNLRVGGAILADNVFAWGEIAEITSKDPEDIAAIQGLQKFNAAVAANDHFRTTILPTAEGLLYAVKLKDE